jgi:hypothetical protein
MCSAEDMVNFDNFEERNLYEFRKTGVIEALTNGFDKNSAFFYSTALEKQKVETTMLRSSFICPSCNNITLAFLF